MPRAAGHRCTIFSRCGAAERGRFIWPTVEGGVVTVSPAQLSYLLSGIDWRNPQETWRPTRVG
ncbi:MAG: transposase [Mesorhizobium sp.]|nr:MAG: transposase [Mesorhizobium sp.]TIV62372.1 MAG: transposase [Mesorhizobium sp.]